MHTFSTGGISSMPKMVDTLKVVVFRYPLPAAGIGYIQCKSNIKRLNQPNTRYSLIEEVYETLQI